MTAQTLSSWIILHHHKHGESTAVAYSVEQPTMQQAAAVLLEEYEPENGEWLEINGPYPLPPVHVWVDCDNGRVNDITATVPCQVLVTELDLEGMNDDDVSANIEGTQRFVYSCFGQVLADPGRVRDAMIDAGRL